MGGKVQHQERHVKLLPVALGIVCCYVVILAGSYFIGHALF